MIVYHSNKHQFLHHRRVTLSPDSQQVGFAPIVIELTEDVEDFAVVAELLAVLPMA